MPINANPIIVGFWSAADTGTTTITWSAGTPSKVFRYVNGANRVQFAAGQNGTKADATLLLGNTYRYDLERTNNNAVIASVTVTTYDVQQNLAGAAISNIDLAKFMQEIVNLTIAPGIDFARISFQTTQPTIPLVTCSAPDGSHAEWFPLFGGLRTKHQCIFGESTPLPQNLTHSYTIVAAGHSFFGEPQEKTVTGTFITGSRHATVIIDTIKVRNDSDKLSAGDIEFNVGAGDADNGAYRGGFEIPEQSISDDDPPLAVGRAIVMPKAPRSLWVQVVGRDDDFDVSTLFAWPPAKGIDVIIPIRFDGEGSFGRVGYYTDSSSVTRVFDIADITTLTTFPIELATGEFKLAFTVFGSIRVDAFVPAKVTVRLGPRLYEDKPSSDLLAAATVVRVPGSAGKDGHLVALGADEAIYHKPLAPERPSPRSEGWTRLRGLVKAPVKVLAGVDGGLHILAFDGDGSVLYQSLDNSGHESPWRNLGGRFHGSLAAVPSRPEELDLFGLAEDGVVYHASFQPDDGKAEGRDWERIGDGVAGSLSAVVMPDGAVGVFALGRDGQVLHKLRRHNEWVANDGTDWQSLGEAVGEQLIVMRPVEEKGVGLATFANNGTLRYIAWPDYPRGRPPRSWKEGGTISDWLESQSPRVGGTEQRASVESGVVAN